MLMDKWAGLVTPAPEWVRHDNPRADRVMLAAWLWRDGWHEIGTAIAAGVATAGTALTDVETRLAEIDAMFDQHDQCANDPEWFAWTNDRLLNPSIPWRDWGEQRGERIVDEARDLAAHLAGVA